jgi:hypothetical protein
VLGTTGCPKVVFKSEVLMNRCLPLGNAAGGAADAVMEAINIDGVATDFVNDLIKAQTAIMIMLGCTMVLTLFFVFIMRWVAGILIRVAFYGLLLGTPALIGFLWYLYIGAKDEYDLTKAVNSTGGTAGDPTWWPSVVTLRGDPSFFGRSWARTGCSVKGVWQRR